MIVPIAAAVLAARFCIPWAGECWTRYTWLMDQPRHKVGPNGWVTRQTKLERRKELLDKAKRLLLESPDGAPLAEIWLVYDQLKDKMATKDAAHPNPR